MSINFWDINWGEDEAKGDKNLERYFVPIPEMAGLSSGTHRYIIGRKGTGKTAIIERLRATCDTDPLLFERYLSLKDFPLPLLRDLGDKRLRDKSQFVPIWSFLMLIELAGMIILDQGAKPLSVKNELATFLRDNFPSRISFVETLTRLSKNNHTVSVFPAWLGGQSSSSVETNTNCSIHYPQVIAVVLDKLKSITSDSTYYIFIDELDEGYRSADRFLQLMLLALLRAVENLSLELHFSNLCFRPVVALRSDIFDRLEDNDLNKFDDRIVRLAWHTEGRAHYSLRDVIEARIAASAGDAIYPAWDAIIDETDKPASWHSDETILTYILGRTYLRPRDVIKFLKCCQKTPRAEKLTFSTVRSAELMYSSWLHNEFRDEVQSFLPVWRQALHCLGRVGAKAAFPFIWLRFELEKDPELARWCHENKKDVSYIIDLLFDYGVIGSIDKARRVSYKYINADASWRMDDIFTVHKGFRKQLRMLDPTPSDIDYALQKSVEARARRQNEWRRRI